MEKKKSKTLSAIRITTDLDNQLNECLEAINKNDRGLKIDLAQLLRIFYDQFTAQVKARGFELKINSKNGKV